MGFDVGQKFRRGLVGNVPDPETARCDSRVPVPSSRIGEYRLERSTASSAAMSVVATAPCRADPAILSPFLRKWRRSMFDIGDHHDHRRPRGPCGCGTIRPAVVRHGTVNLWGSRRIAHVDDRGAHGWLHVADKGIAVLHHDLPPARDVEAAETADVAGQFVVRFRPSLRLLLLSVLRRQFKNTGVTRDTTSATQSALPRLEENSVMMSPSDFFSARRK